MLLITVGALCTLAAGSTISDTDKGFHERAATGLNRVFTAAGKLYFGTATDNSELSNVAYATKLNNTADFGQITPSNSMKWDAIEPERNTFAYAKGDELAALAKQNGQKLRCHNLVWYNQLPSWVSGGNFDNATLVEILKNHVTKEVTHYKDRCYAWDVVNEAISDTGDGSYRSNVFYQTIGEAYIPIAFAAAAAADPHVKLYYNDYSIESAGAKATAAQNIVKMIKAYGVKIDGVGLQSHFIVGQTPSTEAQVANMKAFTALGVEVAITELDIRTAAPETTEKETQQATDYASTVRACMQVEKCVGITLWDWTDKYSWIPSTFPGQGAALPWDEDLKKKAPVYDAILSAVSPPASTGTSHKAASGAASGPGKVRHIASKYATESSASISSDAVATMSKSSSGHAQSTSSTHGAGASSIPLAVDALTAAATSVSKSRPTEHASSASAASLSSPAAEQTASETPAPTVASDRSASPVEASYTTFSTLCTETTDGTTITTIHVHSAPVVAPSSNAISSPSSPLSQVASESPAPTVLSESSASGVETSYTTFTTICTETTDGTTVITTHVHSAPVVATIPATTVSHASAATPVINSALATISDDCLVVYVYV